MPNKPLKTASLWSALLLAALLLAVIFVPLAFSKQVFSTYRLPKAVILWLSGSLAWLFFGLKSLKAKKLKLPPALFFWLPFVFLFWLFLSSFFALRPIISFVGYQNSYLGFLTYAALLGLYLASFSLATEATFKLLFLRIVAALGFFLSFWAWLQFFGLNYPSSFAEFGGQRVGSFIGNPNNLGGFLVFLLPLSFSYYFTTVKAEKHSAYLKSALQKKSGGRVGKLAKEKQLAILKNVWQREHGEEMGSRKQTSNFGKLQTDVKNRRPAAIASSVANTEKLFAALSLLFVFTAVVLTRSASALGAAFLVSFFYTVSFRASFSFKQRLIFLSLLLLLAFLLLWAVIPSEQASVASRFNLWQAGLKMVQAKPLFGFGLDNLRYATPLYVKPNKLWLSGEKMADLHNIFINLAASAGVIPAVVLLSFIFSLLVKGLSFSEKEKIWQLGLTTSLLGFVLFMQTTPDSPALLTYFWLTAGLLVGSFSPLLNLKPQLSWVLTFIGLTFTVFAVFFSYQQLTAESYFRLAMRATTAPEALALTKKATASAPYYEYYYGVLAGKAIDMSEDVSKEFLPFVKEAATQGLKITPFETNLYAALGFYYLLLEPKPNYNEAKRNFQLAVKKDPYNLNAVYGLSKTFFLAGDKAKGKKWLLTLEKLTSPENENLQELKRLANEKVPAAFQK